MKLPPLLHPNLQIPAPLGESVPGRSPPPVPEPASPFSQQSRRSELTLPQWLLSRDVKKQLVEVHVGLVLQ